MFLAISHGKLQTRGQPRRCSRGGGIRRDETRKRRGSSRSILVRALLRLRLRSRLLFPLRLIFLILSESRPIVDTWSDVSGARVRNGMSGRESGHLGGSLVARRGGYLFAFDSAGRLLGLVSTAVRHIDSRNRQMAIGRLPSTSGTRNQAAAVLSSARS